MRELKPHHSSNRDGHIMQTVLVTGAAGGIGTRLRKLLKGVYPNIQIGRASCRERVYVLV